MNLRRTISGIIAGVTLITGAGIMPAAVAEEKTPVLKVDFDTAENYTLHGGASLAAGRNGNALSLNGANGAYARITDGAAAMKALTGDYSISVWFNPAATTVWSRVYDLGTDTSNYVFLTTSSGSLPRYAVKSGTEQSVDSDTAFATGAWHNVTVVSSGGTTDFYLDGFKRGTTTSITYKPGDVSGYANMYLGKSQWDDPYFNGFIDDFEVYDCALTEEEIHSLAAEAYEQVRNENILKNNCYVVNTAFCDGENNEIFAYEGGDIKISATVENDTALTGTVSAEVCAVAADGSETKLSDGAEKNIGMLETAEYAFEIKSDKIPAATDKISLKVTTDGKTYDAAALYASIKPPLAAPSDSGATTIGAHDPSIVKFPNDPKYYAYASHHLIFESEDLINWRKYDFTNKTASAIAPKTCEFVEDNINSNVNGTYWAPDVIYREDDEKPYWMYISVSCGLGGRNSVVGLIKSPTPLFWADPDADKVAEIEDTGVVFATKDNDSYITNAIDAHIYTDSASGWTYYIYGSFWGGIQAIPLDSKGRVSGVNYANDDTIMRTCVSVAKQGITSIFTQKRGVAGPEGAWMHENGDYRYCYTSYAWLGSNYNTRVARGPLSTDFNVNTAAQLVDANGVAVGQEYGRSGGAVSASEITGYKLIGSYRLGDGSMTMKEDSSSNSWYYERGADDAHIYYGSGHNSVITAPDGEVFYCSHVRKDNIEGVATLQIRKVLYTADGWPVVSAVSYAGEKEQALPKEMLLGTYDLASVGKTKLDGTTTINENWTDHKGNRNYDLPVVSSKVTLNADGTMGSDLGTWTFDGDHTITLQFAKNGDETKDEFYKNGDVMTLYALYGYDRDEKEAVIALTGTDQNHITQFAKKSVTNVFKTPARTIENTQPTAVEKSVGGNPELGFDADGNVLYAGDPAATVVDTDGDGEGDTVYIIAGHDTASGEDYVMPEWVAYSSTDMTNWEYKGAVMNATDISWRNNDTSAWASQMTAYPDPDGDKYMWISDITEGDTAEFVLHDAMGEDVSKLRAYVAVYDTDKKLKSVKMKSFADDEITSDSQKITITADNSENSSDVRLFVWNGMKPVNKKAVDKMKYYLYFCTWDKTSSGKQSIGVAVADSPEGPYTDALGKPLISGSFTTPESAGHDDIDPTVLIDTDEHGVEHRYLAWGNTRYYICELNEDMISVKDIDGDGQIVMHKDVKERKIKSAPASYTEAPWLYKRGGKYYMFYAMGWREEMAYAMCDTPMGRYDYKQTLMPPTATSNTNHPSVIDFKGKTYFIYHNGALPHGSGFRRSVCIEELEFDENGYVYPITETSVGIGGKASVIVTMNNACYIAHDALRNPSGDASYPISCPLTIRSGEDGYNTAWEIEAAKYVPEGENKEYYVSIQSVNKPGLYIKAVEGGILLTQDADGAQGRAMTFKTVKGIEDENGVSFESVMYPNNYLTVSGSAVTLSTTGANATFYIGEATQKDAAAINIAEIEAEPTPAVDITEDFNSRSTGTLISLTSSSEPYTDINGLTLYMGTRDSDWQPSQNFAIQTGGETGNALVLNAGKYQSASRGPRMKINTPVIPDGYTVTAELRVKQGSAGSELRYNDSTSNEAGTSISGLTTSWQTLRITISNDSDLCTRTIQLGDAVLERDYSDTFPVLWGTTANNSGQSVYFDNLSITTALTSAE